MIRAYVDGHSQSHLPIKLHLHLSILPEIHKTMVLCISDITDVCIHLHLFTIVLGVCLHLSLGL